MNFGVGDETADLFVKGNVALGFAFHDNYVVQTKHKARITRQNTDINLAFERFSQPNCNHPRCELYVRIESVNFKIGTARQ